MNEGTNYKHRSPNKWRGNRKITWKRIQHNDNQDDQKPWKQNGENESINKELKESINKDLEELKTKHTETYNTITEIENTLEGINSRISEAAEWVNELKDKMVEIISEEQNKVKRMKRAEDNLKDL